MSAASTATLRTAVIRAMDTEPSPRASRVPSHAFTVALVKPEAAQARTTRWSSPSARLSTRRVIGEEALSSSRDSTRCQSATRLANTKSFMFSPLLSALVNITSIKEEHQAKPHGNLGPSLRRVKLGGKLSPNVRIWTHKSLRPAGPRI